MRTTFLRCQFPYTALAVVLMVSFLSGCGLWKNKSRLPEVVVSEREPPVRRESNADHWRCDQDGGGMWSCDPRQQLLPEPTPKPEAVQEPQTEPVKAAGVASQPTLEPDGSRQAPAPSGSEPESRSDTASVSKLVADKPAASDSAGNAVVTTAEVEGSDIETPSETVGSGVANTLRAGDYVVQVGAFRRQEGATKAASSILGVEVEILTTADQGGDWYILLIGAWPTLAGAQEAAARFLDTNPEGDTWIRRGSAVLDSIAPNR